MENFQLYRTNLLIGGQMKYDVVVTSKNASELKVSNFHLSPISNNISYVYKSDETLLNNSHTDNIKEYYNKVKGNFYNPGLNSEFNHNWPILCKENEILDAYSNIYDMGCKRIKEYSRYNKQFEYFCPLWIEKLSKNIKFRFTVKPYESDTTLIIKSLNILLDDSDNFSKYINEYINASGIKEGNCDLINIELDNITSKITGLDVSSGIFCTKNISTLTSNMSSRERPLMETDNMIIQSFVNNTIIAKQLFNFNICFNLQDLLSPVIIKDLKGKKFTINLEVYIDDQLLEKRDFYTNYDFIEKSIQSDDTSINEDKHKFNVLDYLKDYSNIDLINKNKFCQSICHWSLLDNNEYIFNVYEGFSGITTKHYDDGNKTSYFENEHHYKDFPNITTKVLNNNINSTNWINSIKCNDNEFIKYMENFNEFKHSGSYINGNTFINGVKYSNLPKLGSDGMYIMYFYIYDDMYFENIKKYLKSNNVIDVTNHLFISRKENFVMIITLDNNFLTYKSFSEIMFQKRGEILKKATSLVYADEDNLGLDEITYYDAIYVILENIIYPKIVSFNGGLLYTNTNGPSKHSLETKYIKNDSAKNYVFRYDGRLKPTFIKDNMNFIYYKDYVSDNSNDSKLSSSKYMKYIGTNYEPLYPSINYSSINKIEKWNYDELPKIFPSEYILKSNNEENKEETSQHVDILGSIEYSWYNKNLCILLSDKISSNVENNEKAGFKSLEDISRKIISDHYNIDDEKLINYIFDKYKINNNLEYKSSNDINSYIYNIELTLK